VSYPVVFTNSAVRDIEELDAYITKNDSAESAEFLLNKIEATVLSLSNNPERGVYPQELIALGIRDYREIFFKPYRIIYRIIDGTVYIYLIVDGRRDMQSLLNRRLLED